MWQQGWRRDSRTHRARGLKGGALFSRSDAGSMGYRLIRFESTQHQRTGWYLEGILGRSSRGEVEIRVHMGLRGSRSARYLFMNRRRPSELAAHFLRIDTTPADRVVS